MTLPLGIDGAVTANCDFTVGADWQVLVFQKAINASGRTVTVSFDDGNSCGVKFRSVVNADVRYADISAVAEEKRRLIFTELVPDLEPAAFPSWGR